MTRASVTTQNQAEQKPSPDLRHFANERKVDARQAQSLWRAATTLSPLATPPRSSALTLMRFPASGLAVNQPGDIYEQEADSMADEIMRMPSTELHRKCTHCEEEEDRKIHRKCAQCEEEEHKLHRKETGAGPATAPTVVHEVLRSPGQPLDAGARAFMEPRFGHDFSRVRVHTDARAAESARAVNALAYTAGPNIVFAHAQYEPQNLVGRRLLSHELAHVVQQQGAEKVRRKREPWRENGCEVPTEATPTTIFRQVAPSPVARRTAAQIFGNAAAVPPVPGMTLTEFRTYTQLQSDWFVEPSLAAGMKRDFLWILLLRAEEGPHILSGIGDVTVSALRGVAAADWAPLIKFCQGTHASGHTVRIFPPLPALADRIAIGRTLAGLEALIPPAVLEFTVAQVQLAELQTEGLLPILTQYWNDYEPRIEQSFSPAPGARGPEMERVLTFLRSLGALGLVPLVLLRGAIPDERWVRNLHRFPLLMLMRLVANLADVSGVKRLILVLHTGTDAPAAFQSAANLFNDLILASPNNLVLMIEGATSLAAITARIPNITSTWGQKVGGVRRISQVLIAGHGSTQTVGLAGTGPPVVNNGAVTYPTEDLVAGQVAEAVVDLLEVVDVEHQEAQRRVVTPRVGDLEAQAIEEMALVEGAREPVLERRVVHSLLEVVVELVVVGELEDGRRADLELVAVLELAAIDAVAVDVKAKRAVESSRHLKCGDRLADHVLHRSGCAEATNVQVAGERLVWSRLLSDRIIVGQERNLALDGFPTPAWIGALSDQPQFALVASVIRSDDPVWVRDVGQRPRKTHRV